MAQGLTDISEFNSGVVIDPDGFFVAALRWPKGLRRPEINSPRTPRSMRNRMLSGVFFDENADVKRFDGEKWVPRNATACIVGPSGNLLKKIKFHKGYEARLPPLRSGQEYIFKEPPKLRGRRPIWDGKKWVSPRVVAIVKDGVIVGSALENPRDDVLGVVGGDKVYKVWPKKANGKFARIGAKKVDGKWIDP